MSEQAKKSLGFMYIATRPCGKVTGMAWDDTGYQKDNAKVVASWIRRGDAVTREERFKDDPMPPMSCRKGEPCECREKKI